jgi:hypothetical protein
MSKKDFERNRFNFLITEARMGLTFCSIALGAADSVERRARNQLNARKAYDAVARFRRDLALTKSQEARLNGLMDKMRANLVQLGERL